MNVVQTEFVDVAARIQALVGVLMLHPGDLSSHTHKRIEGLTESVGNSSS